MKKDSGEVRVLVVEDEASVRHFLRHSLESQGFVVAEAAQGEEALAAATSFKPALVVLDYGLPDISGLEVLKRLRRWSRVPVLFLTARGGAEDKVAALDAGADDYVTKPFGVPEFLARVRVALRHAEVSANEEPVFSAGALRVDLNAKIVFIDAEHVKLSATEYALFAVLVRHAGRIVAHRQILKEVWGPNSVEHNHYLRVYFGMIRKKLETLRPGSGAWIENESGVGYRLRVPEAGEQG